MGSGEGKQMFRPEGGEVDRESWESKLAYLLATIGYAVGRGSVWRCQYQTRKKRGGWDPCIVHCCCPACEKVRSVSRQAVWPMRCNNMSD